MDELSQQISNLFTEYNKAVELLNLDELKQKLNDKLKSSNQPDFWNNPQEAQATMKEISNLQASIDPWDDIASNLKELKELSSLNDSSLTDEIKEHLNLTAQKLTDQKQNLRFSGPHDGNDAIVSVYSGAGGTDAQDWAQMLQRMYTRWAEKNKFKAKLLDIAVGEEAGIKSATLEITGHQIYGKLKNEHGVHRLVRLSPFNSDQKRHTSFAKVDVLPKIDQPQELEILESDLKIDVYRAGGHGGQSVNTTDSAVRVTHLPTNISVAIQNERSQLQNKETAMTILRSRLARLQDEQHKKDINELKGPNQSAEWGNQIRSYVLHPYKQVKDLRSGYETSDALGVLDGDLEALLNS